MTAQITELARGIGAHNLSNMFDADWYAEQRQSVPGQLWQRVGESATQNRMLHGVSARTLWSARQIVRQNAAHEVKHWGDDRGTLRAWESELLNYPNGADGLSGIIRAGVRVR